MSSTLLISKPSSKNRRLSVRRDKFKFYLDRTEESIGGSVTTVVGKNELMTVTNTVKGKEGTYSNA